MRGLGLGWIDAQLLAATRTLTLTRTLTRTLTLTQVVDLRARLESVSGAEQQLRGEAAAQDAELAATADDLRKMIRENQAEP